MTPLEVFAALADWTPTRCHDEGLRAWLFKVVANNLPIPSISAFRGVTGADLATAKGFVELVAANPTPLRDQLPDLLDRGATDEAVELVVRFYAHDARAPAAQFINALVSAFAPSARPRRLQLHLIDHDEDVANALHTSFAGFPEVEVKCADLLVEAHDTVVSPANSAGFMDGGIDAAYVRVFGASIEAEIRKRVSWSAGGLAVGASLSVRVNHPRVHRLIVAPTMEHPESVPAINARRAMAAILRRASEENVQHLFCPGLCTGVGQVDPVEAAEQMRLAYETWASRQDSSSAS